MENQWSPHSSFAKYNLVAKGFWCAPKGESRLGRASVKILRGSRAGTHKQRDGTSSLLPMSNSGGPERQQKCSYSFAVNQRCPRMCFKLCMFLSWLQIGKQKLTKERWFRSIQDKTDLYLCFLEHSNYQQPFPGFFKSWHLFALLSDKPLRQRDIQKVMGEVSVANSEAFYFPNYPLVSMWATQRTWDLESILPTLTLVNLALILPTSKDSCNNYR